MSKFIIYSGLKLAQIFFKTAFSSALLALTIFGQTKPETDVRPLTIDKPIERELKSDEAHLYSLTLQVGQFLSAVVEQKGIDVVVTLFDAEGKKIVEVDSPNGAQGDEPLTLIIEKTGNYILEVRSLEKSAPAGRYEAKIKELRTATEKDKNILAARKVFDEAESLQLEKSVEARQQAIEKYEESALLYRAAEDHKGEGQCYSSLGNLLLDLSQYEKAEKSLIRSLAIRKELKDERGIAAVLTTLGVVYINTHERKKSQDSLEQALAIWQELKDKKSESGTLLSLGSLYLTQGDYERAQLIYERTLTIKREIKDRLGEGSVLMNLGLVSENLSRNEKALDYLEQSLAIAREIKNAKQEGQILLNLGSIYTKLGQLGKARTAFEQSAVVMKSFNRRFEAFALNNLGAVLMELAQYENAKAIFEQALAISEEFKDKYSLPKELHNLGTIYNYLQDYEKAQQFYEKALAVERETGARESEGETLNNLGIVYLRLKQYEKAIQTFNEALVIKRETEDRYSEGFALNNLGITYSALNQYEKAREFFEQALIAELETGNRQTEGDTLNELGMLYKKTGASRLAVFYEKQAGNVYQAIRSSTVELDQESRQSYSKSVESTYRQTAEELIQQKRLPEAQQVLNAFKDQQFFDLSRTQIKKLTPFTLTPREADYAARYEKHRERIETAKERLDEIKQKIGKREPDIEEQPQAQKLELELKISSDDFLTVLKGAETEFVKPPDEKDKIGEIADLTQMQNTLREISVATKQKTVAVYQLVGEENFSAMIIADDSIKSVSVPIKNTILDEKARQLWALLQSDKYDTTKLSKEIYDVVFKPLEKEIPQDTTTIMWSLDGNLRYLPMAALFDGKQFLAERYNHVNFTRADSERLTRAVNPNWTGTGFGTSNAQTVELLGDKISFSALPGVTEELKEIFKQSDSKIGVLTGVVLPDKQFTKTSFLDALRQKRPVVHIASHFSFRPGDEARSFLLLGDGTAFTLADMKAETNLFTGVELLTLSACNTAAQQPDAKGREIDGFAELAQRLGAGAVMATLWSVSDASTPWLMRDFYATRQSRTGTTKAEALRRAQLALLNGTAATKPLPAGEKGAPTNKLQIVIVPNGDKSGQDKRRSETVYIGEKDAPLYKKNNKKPFAHPYFWSPFILFGNWR